MSPTSAATSSRVVLSKLLAPAHRRCPCRRAHERSPGPGEAIPKYKQPARCHKGAAAATGINRANRREFRPRDGATPARPTRSVEPVITWPGSSIRCRRRYLGADCSAPPVPARSAPRSYPGPCPVPGAGSPADAAQPPDRRAGGGRSGRAAPVGGRRGTNWLDAVPARADARRTRNSPRAIIANLPDGFPRAESLASPGGA